MIFSVDCDVCKWLGLMDTYCHGFSAGKLLAASCLNCRLNPSLFTYCTHHVAISTNCVWLKVKCILIGWFHLKCLWQSLAISRTHSSPTLNQANAQTGKQVLCISRPTPCVDICAYAQISWVGKQKCMMH